ncbi:MAG: transglutaminase domain-containing protein [Nitrospirae bacterium]|nr:transglutaminase domain-containing protein [Nitrospirota bacterium]
MGKNLFHLALCLFLIFSCKVIHAKTVILEGRIDSRITVTQQMSFSVDRGLNKFMFRFALPATFSNKVVSQDTKTPDIRFDPEPARIDDEIDSFGNRFKSVTWNNINRDVRVNISFETYIKSDLTAMESKAAFPLKSIPQGETVFLKSTKMVQSDSAEITALAKELTAKASAEYEAVTAILNHVSDNVKYTYNPPQYDALYTMKTKSGNCQNYAHMSMALLRAAGIPARIVGGISLKESWKIPLDANNYLVQSIGQGGHAWMEVYFPDFGWMSYDPQQSKQFTSTRHIKQTHGLDSTDINDSWKASPYLPEYNENIDAKFLADSISLAPKFSDSAPRSYLFSNNFIAKAGAPRVEEKPKPIVEATPVPVLPKEKNLEFGNMEFPNLVDLYQVIGDRGVRIMDKETAEYVTSRHVYAQAFDIDEKLQINELSLAMRKFGGDGTVYIDLVSDDNTRPSLKGTRSQPLFLDNIKKRRGYYWVDFRFPDKVALEKGRYWIVLRHSGEAIMNWFYIPGNPFGDSDDTRSTLKGYKWEDIQNYDFVFKVKAERL